MADQNKKAEEAIETKKVNEEIELNDFKEELDDTQMDQIQGGLGGRRKVRGA